MSFLGHEPDGERHMGSNDEENRVDGASSAVGSGDGTESEIAGAIARGDHRAALLLCAREHGAAIGRLCMAMVGAQAEAEDLTQETLLAAHAGFTGFQGAGSVRSWLFSIARRKCARHLEERTNRTSKLKLASGTESGPEPEELVARRKLAQQARAALAEIRPSEREALLLRYASELSFREVGDACGIDEATARKRVSRALQRMRAALSEKES